MSYTKENELMDEDISSVKEFEEKYVSFYNNFDDCMKTISSILSSMWLW